MLGRQKPFLEHVYCMSQSQACIISGVPTMMQDLAAMKVAEIRRNTGPAVMPKGVGASATNSGAAKPVAAAKQKKAELTTEDIISYAERLNGRFASALTLPAAPLL